MIWAFFKAVFLMGMPLAVLTYFLVRWSLAAEAHTPGDGDIALKAWLKALKKRPKKKHKSVNKVHAKWMRFGGGFYGCMAVFTYLFVELTDFINLLYNLGQLEHWFDHIGFDLVVKFLIGSLTNFLDALLWFVYWPQEIGTEYPVAWLIAAYLGYLAGAHAAWQEAAGTFSLPTKETLPPICSASWNASAPAKIRRSPDKRKGSRSSLTVVSISKLDA
ncbi:hypothetical protein [Kordiimonas marina]|uniref:hypothetical protein n=1 Tax=Kordiimonas marina TaxID=2872312 RepID=UPI001FF38833|nr:hypothetical protein [Kordiimonas marina]MCJ9430337.1 hypothetical protein [Kordiimonas marina]